MTERGISELESARQLFPDWTWFGKSSHQAYFSAERRTGDNMREILAAATMRELLSKVADFELAEAKRANEQNGTQ